MSSIYAINLHEQRVGKPKLLYLVTPLGPPIPQGPQGHLVHNFDILRC